MNFSGTQIYSDQPNVSRAVRLTPLNIANAKPLDFGLIGDTTYAPASNSGGWQVVERPKRVAATQWVDRQPWSLVIEGIINHSVVSPQSIQTVPADELSIEADCRRLEEWMDHTPGALEPPVFSVTGPLPGQAHLWVIFSLEFNDALRNRKAGYRYQQHFKITLYEYNPPFGSLLSNYKQNHVETYYYNTQTGTESFQTYTVKQGDTLRKIANKYKFGKSAYARLQELNNIRDPRNLVVGQTLIIPASL
jgi:hypothetical protein